MTIISIRILYTPGTHISRHNVSWTRGVRDGSVRKRLNYAFWVPANHKHLCRIRQSTSPSPFHIITVLNHHTPTQHLVDKK